MTARIYFLDNLRTFLIFLVVLIHSGLVYEPVLMKNWIVIDPEQNSSIGLIRMYLDLFVMYSIFFVSGYFVHRSVVKLSVSEFTFSKFKRLILPWFMAVLTLIPLYKVIFLYSRGMAQEEWYTYFHIFQRSGSDLAFYSNYPTVGWLWFLPVLFIFQIIYKGLYVVDWIPKRGNPFREHQSYSAEALGMKGAGSNLVEFSDIRYYLTLSQLLCEKTRSPLSDLTLSCCIKL